jgi:hypothetical protein
MKGDKKIFIYVLGGIALATGIYYLSDNERMKTALGFIKDKLKLNKDGK